VSVTHHPGDELLWSQASGAGSLAQSLLIQSHLSYCPKCRDEIAILESLGGALLRDTPPQPLAENALQTAITRLDGATIAKPEPSLPLSIARPVPPPLRRFVGADLDRVRWRRVTRGLSYRMLLKRGGARVYLTKSAPGSGIGLHTHHGNELTLVLAGGFSDEAGSYTEGDIVLTTPAINHTPVADDDGDCITLAMTDAPLKFRNIGAGLVARIFGF
jgi:putative transcriptional regulator